MLRGSTCKRLSQHRHATSPVAHSILHSLPIVLLSSILLCANGAAVLKQPSMIEATILAANDACSTGKKLVGVTCEGGVPVSLDLSRSSIGGSIPASISALKTLTYLDLSYCTLIGVIPPEVGLLTGLVVLDLSSNDLLGGTIPGSFSKLAALQKLDLGGPNQLEGPIPKAMVANMLQLTVLDLDRTQVTGPIPEETGNLKRLQSFDLSYTPQLTGTLPASLGSLSMLKTLLISEGKLTGPIPGSFSKLKALDTLDLSGNELTGSIPQGLSALRNVAYMSLQNNRLSGRIPENLSGLRALLELSLANNQLTGSIPSSLWTLPLRDLNLSTNELWGTLPTIIGTLRSLTVLDLSSNFFSGVAPGIPSTTTKFVSYANNYFWSFYAGLCSLDVVVYMDTNCLPRDNTCTQVLRPKLQCDQFCIKAGSRSVVDTTAPLRPCDTLGVCIPTQTESKAQSSGKGRKTRMLLDKDKDAPLFQCVQCQPGYAPDSTGTPPNQSCIPTTVQPPVQVSPFHPPPAEAPPPVEAPSSTLSVAAIAGIAAGGAVLLLAIGAGVALWFFCVKRRQQQNKVGNDLPTFHGLRKFTLAEISKSTDCFNQERKLNLGPKGTFYSGTLPRTDPANPGMHVLIRKQRLTNLTTTAFMNQVRKLASAAHENLLPLKGCCFEDDQMLLVYEMVSQNTIRNVLDKEVQRAQIAAVKREEQEKKAAVTKVDWAGEDDDEPVFGKSTGLTGWPDDDTPEGSPKADATGTPHNEEKQGQGSENGLPLEEQREEEPLTWEQRLRMAIGTAEGLSYMHKDANQRIVHGNLRTCNTIVDQDFTPKMADFGLHGIYSAARGSEDLDNAGLGDSIASEGPVDPFMLMGSAVNKKNDVFSLGVLMLELATDWEPVEEVDGVSTQILHRVLAASNSGNFTMIAAPALKPHIVDDTPQVAAPEGPGVGGTAPVGGHSRRHSRSHSKGHSRTGSITGFDLSSLVPLVTSGSALAAAPTTPSAAEGAGAGRVELPPGGISLVLFKRFVCLALWCCTYDQSARPNIAQVVRVLQNIGQGRRDMGEEEVVLDRTGSIRGKSYGSLPSF